MTLVLASAARTAVSAAICGLADAGAGAATIQVATSNTFSTILATFACSDPAFTAGAAGVQTLDVTPALSVAASNSGTATHWRLRDSTPTLVMTGEVKTTDGGEDIILADIARNAGLDAIDALIGTGGDIQFLTAGDVVLATINLGNPAFGTASAGSMAMTGTPTGNATVAGTATKFRIRDTADAVVLDGSVGTSAADLIISNNVFGIGSTITISALSLSLPASTGSSGTLVFSAGVAFTTGETVEILSGSYTTPA